MSADRELLELAAKAAGIELDYRRGSDAYYYDDPETGREEWHPHQNDGQALRLAVKLGLELTLWGSAVQVQKRGVAFTEESVGDDRAAATRRAIVRVAAEIGRATP